VLNSIYHAFLARVRKDGTLPQADRLLVILLFNLCVELQNASHMPVRDLGEEVHISTAAVNDGILRLKNAGYIQAELRRRKRENGREYGKEIWHISFSELEALGETVHGELTMEEFAFDIYIHKRISP